MPSLLEAFGHDQALLDETLGVFLADAPAQIEAIRQAVASGDPAAMARAAHALKGAVSLFSLGAAYTPARALETAARAGLPDRLPTQAGGDRTGGEPAHRRPGGDPSLAAPDVM